MTTAFVVVVSLLVGAATYVATVRAGRRVPAAVGFEGASAAAAVAIGPGVAPEDEALGDAHAPDAEIVDLEVARATSSAPAEAPDVADIAPAGPVVDEVPASSTPMPLPPVIVNAPTIPGPEPGYAYLRVTTERPSWRDRIAGVVGIAVLLVVGAAAIAFGIYQLGSGINALIQRFLDG